MAPTRPTRLPLIAISATAVLASALTAISPDVLSYVRGKEATQGQITINEQTSLTGSGAKTAPGATGNSSKFYDYVKYFGYQPLTQTGGQLKDDYVLGRFVYPESYTGALVGDLCIDIATAPTSNATFVDVVIRSVDSTSSGTVIANNVALTVGAKCTDMNATGNTIGPNQEVVLLSLFGTGAGLVADWNGSYRQTELN